MKKIWASAVVTIIILLVPLQMISANSGLSPLRQYNYDADGIDLDAPSAYLPGKFISGESLGIGAFVSPYDIFVSPSAKLYITDSGNNRIVVYDETNKETKTISTLTDYKGEVSETFSEPKGIFVVEDEHKIYVCDTGNQRLVIMDTNGKYIHEILSPGESVLGPNQQFKPIRVAVDCAGVHYLIADGIFKGIMEFKADYQFRAFIGAIPVQTNPLISIWKKILTREQVSKMIQYVPTEYSSLCIDNDGFMYASINTIDWTAPGKIKKLNSFGKNIMRVANGKYPMGDIAGVYKADPPRWIETLFVDVAAWNNGLYSGLDLSMGRVFTYDNESNLLFVFGNIGSSPGTFIKPTSIDVQNRNIYVVDESAAKIFVFTPTDYANSILNATAAYEDGEYVLSKQFWQNVADANSNIPLAYIGLSRCALRLKDYKSAMEYARLGKHRLYYSMAMSPVRKALLKKLIPWFLIGLFIIAVFAICRSVWKKRNPQPAKIRKGYLGALSYSYYIMFHPFDGFWDMKNEKRGSKSAAFTILALFCVTHAIFVPMYTGFLYNDFNLREVNILMNIIGILAIFLLYTLSNRFMSNWIYGQAKYDEICMYTCYALTPSLLMSLLRICLSNVFLLDESMLLSLISMIGFVWSAFLLIAGNIVIHQYEPKRGIYHLFFTFIQIMAVIFIAIVSFNMIQQIIGFVNTIYAELSYR